MRKLSFKKITTTALAVFFASSVNLTVLAPVLAQVATTIPATHSSSQLIAQSTPTTDLEVDILADEANADPNSQVPGQAETCEGSFAGVGWIMCQVMRMIFDVFSWFADEILADELLEVDLINDEEPLKVAWSGFRTIANLFFVLAFMIIIYAEASGRFGVLETYSVGRLLPRLAIAVIGIQLSYFIVGYSIEVFNDLGAGVGQLTTSPVAGFSQFEVSGYFEGLMDDTSFWGIPLEGGGLTADNVILIFGAAVAGLAAIIFLPTILLFGAFGMFLLLVTLIARKIIIIGLVMVSPLAFASYILPGTQKYFKQWWDMFIKTLAMYPLIMLFLASGKLLGRLIVSGEEVTPMQSMIGFIATFLPFFLIPLTFKLAGSAVAGIASGLSGMNDKVKGDMRDPNSVRSRLKQKRGQRYSRAMQGQAYIPGTKTALVPKRVRTLYNRLPGVDTNAPHMDDIINGRKWTDNMSSTIGDDVIRAIALTGGGRRKGFSLRTADGGSDYSGRLKFGKHLAYDNNGSLMYNRDTGIAQLAANDGSLSDIKKDDFYDNEIMSQVNKLSGDRGFQQASTEYAMVKSKSIADQSRVWEGLDSTRWSKDEKIQMAQGTWYNSKDTDLQHKFGDYGSYFHENTHDDKGQTRQMGFKLGKMTEYVDQAVDAYSLSKQGGAFWKTASDGLRKTSAGSISVQQKKELTGMAMKAQSLLPSNRTMRSNSGEQDEASSQLMGSQAVSEAARNAEEFLEQYKDKFGQLPDLPTIANEINPNYTPN